MNRATQRPATSRWVTPACLAVIVVWVFAVYANSFGNAFVFDDMTQIVHNTAIRSFANIRDIFSHDLAHFGASAQEGGKFFRPVQSMMLMADYALWGLEPFGYHLTNTAAHALVAVLLFFLMRGITRDAAMALVITLLYAAHPVHTEAVTYVSGRADPLGTVFLLSIMLLQRRFWTATRPAARAALYAAIMILFAVSLLTKEFSVAYPVLLIFAEYCLRDERRYTSVVNRRSLFYLPFALVIGIWLVLKNMVVPTESMVVEKIALSTRLIAVPRLVFDYLRISFLPLDLHMEYTLPFPRSVFQSGYFGPFLFLLVFAPVVWYLWRRGKSDAVCKTLFFGIGWFLLGLLPYFNILFQLNATFAEHWLYVPLMGLSLAVVYAVFTATRHNAAARATALGIFVAALLAYSARAVAQNAVWKDPMTFYTYTIARAPHSAKVHNNLALEYIKLKDYKKARAILARSIALDPHYLVAQENMAMLEREAAARGIKLEE